MGKMSSHIILRIHELLRSRHIIILKLDYHEHSFEIFPPKVISYTGHALGRELAIPLFPPLFIALLAIQFLSLKLLNL